MNPFVWLSRFRYRCGYGVHSPFAYNLITQVLYCPGRYYADEWLEEQFSSSFRLLRHRRIVISRLLFRLANYWQPSVLYAPDAQRYELQYLHAGCKGARIVQLLSEGRSEMLYVTRPKAEVLDVLQEGSLLIVGDLRHNKEFWRQLKADARTRVTFDLYDIGLAFFNPHLQRQDYIVNW